jgi:hypothetical protein
MILKDLLLIKLPKIPNIDKEFYGIGYFAENGDFIFALLTPSIIKNFPLRSVKALEWKPFSDNVYLSDKPKIIGKIEELK